MRSRLACDFCGETQDQVKLLIRGPHDIAICDACVDLCVGIINGSAPISAPTEQTQESE